MQPRFSVVKRDEALQNQIARPRNKRRALWAWALIMACAAVWAVIAYVLWEVI